MTAAISIPLRAMGVPEFVPEALALGRDLPRGGKPELAGGVAVGALLDAPARVRVSRRRG